MLIDNKDKIFLSSTQKEAKDKEWYKQQMDELDTNGVTSTHGYGSNDSGGVVSNGVSEYKRMKVNYDLFNNILNVSDLEYVCNPFSEDVGELPANMVNRDIVSGKVKSILGMEMKRAFPWKVIATNPEATSRREQEEFGQIRNFVVDSIMRPIREQAEMQKQQELKGRELTPKEQEDFKKQLEAEIQSKTPDEVRKYMEREHQDPAEVLSHQLLEYLTQKCDLKRKFNDVFKHSLISAKGLMYVGIHNGEPEAWTVNPMRFNCDKSPDSTFVEDSEWATCEYRMTPSEVIKYFGDENIWFWQWLIIGKLSLPCIKLSERW